ncbi:MAG: polymer-forming cytoskeletal protein [Defluviitaleaceae bacterium]|nr:polymer-forming cytoskeletal protein [Defluviitaleaceae bacterium]
MFGKKAVIPQVEVPGTVIGKGITLEAAVLTGKESVRIDGVFLGDVKLDGSLILGETGSIEGTIKAKYIILAGLVRGNIECDGTLHVSSTARINGDIKTNSIIVDEGGQLNGRYQVGELPMISADKQPLIATSTSGDDKSYLDKSLEIVDKRDQDN